MKARLSLTVNGEAHDVLVPVHKTLLEVLREDLGLTGTKHGCELGECGTCTVLVDGVPVLSCLALPVELEGAAKCGYCTPGILMTAQALLHEEPAPGRERIREALAGNLCRCTGYTKILDAVELAVLRMAYGKLLRSPHAHARITGMDTTRARALPGVYAVITGADLPPVKFGILPVSQDEEGLCTEKVRMVGDAVVAVAAVDEETAERACALIEVGYEPLPSLMSIEESLAHPEVRIHEYGDGPNVHKNVALQFGDVEAAFARAHLVREDVFFYEGNTHLPMEQHAAVAHWTADGKLTLWSSTQTPHYVHRLLAKILDVPAAHIRVIAAPVGGGFGGKLDPFAHEIAACKLSQLTGRPVKIAC